MLDTRIQAYSNFNLFSALGALSSTQSYRGVLAVLASPNELGGGVGRFTIQPVTTTVYPAANSVPAYSRQ